MNRANAALARCLSATPLPAERAGRAKHIIAAPRQERNAVADRLDAIASRVRRNIPLGSDPVRFHEEKSEVARDIAAIADELRR